MTTLDRLRATLDAAVAELRDADLAEAIGACAAAQARLLAKLTVPTPAPTAATDELVDAAEMGRRVGLPEHHLRDQGRRWIKTNGREGLPAVKHGHYMRFAPADVLEAIRRNRMSTPAQPEKLSNGKGQCPSVSKSQGAVRVD